MKYRLDEDTLEIDTMNTYDGKTIEDFLNDYHQSKKNKYLLIQKQLLLLDGKIVRDIHEPINGQTLTLRLEKSQPDWKAADTPCKVIYEDAFLYLVHKEPGYIIHGDCDDTECLNAQAAQYQLMNHIQAPVRPIHRLDKETTGLVLYSKIPFFQPWFDAQLEEKKIARNYLAICYGKAKIGQTFTFNQAIGKDRHVSNRYRLSPSGQAAITHVKCLDIQGQYCLMKCSLETGRTHQIRVHLSSHGYPIVNDRMYGSASIDFPRMELWAYEIEFRNPITHKKHRIQDEPNIDFNIFNKGERI